MATVATKMTADEFVAWLEGLDNGDKVYELERGEVVEMPSPGELHGVICFLIVRLLGNDVFQRGKGYLCSNDTGLLVEHDPDTVRGPDIMLFAVLVAGGLGLFVLGGYLALAGHRSHLYRWNNRNTVFLLDEIRRLHATREKSP
jgi:hypothetical protein